MQSVEYVISRWIEDERGVTSIEYALMGSLVAIAILSGVNVLGGSLGNLYQRVAASVLAAMQ